MDTEQGEAAVDQAQQTCGGQGQVDRGAAHTAAADGATASPCDALRTRSFDRPAACQAQSS